MRCFFRQSLVLNLEIEIALAEDVVEGDGGFAGRVVLPFRQPLGDFALQTCRQTDQPLRVLGQKFLADARLVVEAVQRSLGDDLHQVAITLVVLGQHDQMVVAVAFGRGAMVFLLADVELAAQDRLHARFFGGIDELDRAEDVAVVGHGDRGHVEFFDALDQAFDVASAIEHGVVGMQMKMNELGLGHQELGPQLCSFYFMRRGTSVCMGRCGKPGAKCDPCPDSGLADSPTGGLFPTSTCTTSHAPHVVKSRFTPKASKITYGRLQDPRAEHGNTDPSRRPRRALRPAGDRAEVVRSLGAESRPLSRRALRPARARSTTSWRCCRIPRARCTWDTCATTPSAMRWRATCGCRATTCFIPWAGMRSDFRPRTRPSRTRRRRANGRCATSPA